MVGYQRLPHLGCCCSTYNCTCFSIDVILFEFKTCEPLPILIVVLINHSSKQHYFTAVFYYILLFLDARLSTRSSQNMSSQFQRGYNNSLVGALMSDEVRDAADARHWDRQPRTKEDDDLDRLTALLESRTTTNKVPPRNKPRKKKKTKGKQTKMKQYFKDKQNEDGYPQKHCKFEPLEGRKVYRPPGHGTRFVARSIVGDLCTMDHCCSCHLKPCLVKEFSEECFNVCFSLDADGASNAETQAAVTAYLQKQYCRLFKFRYNKKHPPLSCVVNFVQKWFDIPDTDDEASELEDESHNNDMSQVHLEILDSSESENEF